MARGLDDTLLAAASDEKGYLDLGQLFAQRYQIEALLGRGGMGAVYRVHDVKLDENVALKVLTLDSDEAATRFVAEVRMARRVTHPNVARTHDFGEHDGWRFLTMELIDGAVLRDLVDEGGPLPAEQVARLGAAIADGLGAAHRAGIVHRDLKPSNVMVDRAGRVVITDFGIAQAARRNRDAHTTQTFMGTPHYMAPEQLTGDPVDQRADIYALGVMLYELATATLPFDGDDPIVVATSRLRGAAPDPRSVAAVPLPLAKLINHCMERDPNARPASAAEVRQTLEGLRLPADATPTPTRLSPIASKLPSSSKLFAPLEPSQRAVAVLPFAYRGPAEHNYLGEGLAEELIDLLCQTKGLKVLALGATRRFASERDPVPVGRELDAGSVVDGTVQLAGERVRLSARLLDATTGEQIWNERYDGSFEDVFALQESLGKRVAEALRVELSASSYRANVPAEAIELYLHARKKLRLDVMSQAEESVALLDRSLELAPGFSLAIAAHAMACVRAWWGAYDADVDDAGQRAYESVQRAIREAPDLAETHQARAMLAVQEGTYHEAAIALQRTLELAPTMAEAHYYLGLLQVETGRVAEGRKRLELTLQLDPSLVLCHMALARLACFTGDEELYARHCDAMRGTAVDGTLAALVSDARNAYYRQDLPGVSRAREQLLALSTTSAEAMAMLLGAVTDDVDSDTAVTVFTEAAGGRQNRRFASLMRQLVTEVLLLVGRNDDALALLDELAADILIDLVWLDRCRLFDPVRDDPRFAEVRRLVRQRTAEIWRR